MPLVTPSVTKQPWTAPKITVFLLSDNTANNASGGGDGDSASAHIS